MLSAFSQPSWFALVVRPNHEHTTEKGLRNQGFEAYLPVQRVRRQWSDRIKELDSVLFPGYVFCRFEAAERLRVLTSPGVVAIVGCGRNPVPVEEEEISNIRTLIASRRELTLWPYVRVGERVRIESGALAGLSGVVVRARDAWRVVVSVEALSCAVAVEVNAGNLAPDRICHDRYQAAY
ncbi:MAG TPA: UpxY family transcription antiterminator [Bryobacteraceae bacterium]|nr:UpxY family transcription antiterminator [Bryobacteraceae bacterium]